MKRPAAGAAAPVPQVSVPRVFRLAFVTLWRRFAVLVLGAGIVHAATTVLAAAALMALTAVPAVGLPTWLIVAVPLAGHVIALALFTGFAVRLAEGVQAGAPAPLRAAIGTGLRRAPAVLVVLLFIAGAVLALNFLARQFYDALGSSAGTSAGFTVVACVVIGQTFLVAAPVAALERRGPFSALARSYRLAENRFWRMGVLTLLAGLIAAAPHLAQILGHVMDVLAGREPASGIAGMLISNLAASMVSLLALALIPAATLLELRRLDAEAAEKMAGVFD